MSFFKPVEKLAAGHADLESARRSLQEELGAIDLYQQMIDATENMTLKQLLEHNMDGDKENAAMLRQWLRENDPTRENTFAEDVCNESNDRGEYVIDYLSGEW